MKITWRYVVTICFAFLVLDSAGAEAEEVTLREYQDVIVRYSTLMGAKELTPQLEALTNEQWQMLYDVTPSKDELVQAITHLENSAQEAGEQAEIGIAAQPLAIGIDVVVDGEFEPRYPDVDTGSDICIASADECYAVFMNRTTLFFLPFVPDDDEIGLQDDRWEEQQEASARGIHENLHNSAILFQVICDASLDFVSVVTCGVAGAAWELDRISEQYLQSSEAHTGNIDSAEIEAAYENTRTILDKANDMSAILDDETNFTDDDELEAHRSNITSTMTSQHRSLNDKLTLINNKLDQQQTQLDEIIRLLNTPQGLRSEWNK